MITLLFTQGYLMAECWPYSCLTGTWERMDRNGDIKRVVVIPSYPSGHKFVWITMLKRRNRSVAMASLIG